MKRRWILQSSIYDREDGRCFYCDREVQPFHYGSYDPSFPYRPDAASMDHIIPQSEGGETYLDNLVLACRECNMERLSEPAETFLLRKAG